MYQPIPSLYSYRVFMSRFFTDLLLNLACSSSLPGASRSLSLESAVSSLQSVVFNLQSTVFLSTVCRLQSSDINLVFILFTEIIMSETWIQTSQVIAWDKGGGTGEEREELDSGPRARAAVRRQRDICMFVYVFIYVCTLTLGLGGGWQRRFLIRKRGAQTTKGNKSNKNRIKESDL